MRRHSGPEVPPIEEVARRTQLYTTGSDALPPPEENSYLNDGIVASSEGGTQDLVGVTPPKNLADLMNQCPTMGDGQYYIEVIRRAPQQFGGVVCKGTQRQIDRYMTDRDFVGFYGGGDYTLTLYGPPPRGGVVDPRTGRMRHKALSPPVKLEISPSVYPPNLQAALLHDDEFSGEEDGDPMRSYNPGFSVGPGTRPATTADAKMLEVQLAHEEKMQERQEAEKRSLREQSRSSNEALAPMLDVLHRNTVESVKALERQAEQRAAQAEALANRAERDRERAEERAENALRAAAEQAARDRDRPTDASVMVEGIAKVAGILNRGDGGQAAAQATGALDAARQEIQRLTQGHNTEMQRLQDKHSAELKRAQDEYRDEASRRIDQNRSELERLDRQHREETKRLEDRLKENIDRAERRAEDAERKAEQRVVDIEARAEKRIGDVRDEMRRALEELRAASQLRLDDERRQHDRDMKSAAASFETRLAGQKDMHENRLSTVTQETTRLNAEIERWRKEAEDNKDIGKHIERLQEGASQLGWGPSNGESAGPEPIKDWKDLVGRVGMELVQKLPDIVQSAGETVSKLRGPAAPSPQEVQAAQYQHMLAGAQNTMARQMAASPGLPPPLRGRDGSVFAPAPLRFGMEDSTSFDTSAPLPRPVFDQHPSPPIAPPQQPQYQQPMAAYQQPQYQQPYAGPEPQTYQPVSVAPPPQAQATYQPVSAAPPPQAQPAQQAAPVLAQQAPPQAPPGSVPSVIQPDMILQFAPVLEQALATGESAEDIAREMLPLLGRDNMAKVISGLKPERVVAELQKAGMGSSPLTRRQGQQFLRDLWKACAALLAPGA